MQVVYEQQDNPRWVSPQKPSGNFDRTADFLKKKHSYLICQLLVYIFKFERGAATQESIYMAWLRHKPSRLAFMNLMKEIEDLGWIKRVPGLKKSSKALEVDGYAIVSALGLQPIDSFVLEESWVFKASIFDIEFFIDRDVT